MENDDAGLYQVEDGWIETYTGKQFHFGRLHPGSFDILDVAHALSLQCRYNGHCSGFYSVAEHCVLMAQALLDHGHTPAAAYAGLMHEVAEAYIGDMVRPLKVKLTSYKVVDENITAAAADVFKFTYPLPQIVKEFDSRMLRDEREQVMSDSGNEWGTDSLEPVGIKVRFWAPLHARSCFLNMYRELRQALEYDPDGDLRESGEDEG